MADSTFTGNGEFPGLTQIAPGIYVGDVPTPDWTYHPYTPYVPYQDGWQPPYQPRQFPDVDTADHTVTSGFLSETPLKPVFSREDVDLAIKAASIILKYSENQNEIDEAVNFLFTTAYNLTKGLNELE